LLVAGIALAVVTVAFVSYSIWASGRESTDDAQVDADVVPISARVAGYVKSVPVQDNASGNFVKVVQRVPVRIGWAKPPDLPLRAGLSCDVTVRLR
jgi:multidrug resistance efflux pump